MKKAGLIVITFIIFLHSAENKVMACSIETYSSENINENTRLKHPSCHQKTSTVGSKKKYRLRGLLPKSGIPESGTYAYEPENPFHFHVIHHSSKLLLLFAEPDTRGPPAF